MLLVIKSLRMLWRFILLGGLGIGEGASRSPSVLTCHAGKHLGGTVLAQRSWQLGHSHRPLAVCFAVFQTQSFG